MQKKKRFQMYLFAQTHFYFLPQFLFIYII